MLLERLAPAGVLTQAFAWVASASAVGLAGGAWLAGSLADPADSTSAFALSAGSILVTTIGVAGSTVLWAIEQRP